MQTASRVLIVEDDFLVGESLRGMLEDEGYSVIGDTASGKQAIEMTKDLEPDVVMMDIGLLEMDGLTAARHITAQCPTPIVALTAHENPDLVAEASESGIGYYLVKPTQRRELTRAIQIATARFEDLMKLRRLNSETQRRENETRWLLEASQAIVACHTFEDAAQRIFDVAREATGAISGYVALMSEDGGENELLFLESGGLPCEVDPDLPMPIRGLRAEAYTRAEVVYDNDFQNSEWMRFIPPKHVEMRNVLFAPLVIQGQAVGVMGLANKPVGFTEDDVRMAKAFGDMAAIALRRVQIEDKLRGSEERLKLALRGGALGTWDWDTQTDKVQFNERWAEMLGYRLEEIEPHLSTWKNLVHPDELPRVSEKLNAHLEGRTSSYEAEFRMQHKSGEWVWVLDRGKVIERDEKGRPLRACGTHLDITDRKQAEEALRTRLRYEKNVARLSQILLEDSETEDVVAKALDYLRDASDAARVYTFENFIDDSDGLCMRQTHESCASDVEPQIGNPTLQHVPYAEGFERWADKLSRGEPIRGAVDTFPPEERAVLEPQDIRSILVLPIQVDRRWHSFIGFDETRFVREWQDEDVRLLQTAAEIIGSYFGRKQMEGKLRDYAAELERSNRDLEQFGYVISHDLRSPARTVKNWLKLLEKRYRGELDEKAKEYIAHAVNGAERMQEMISALLDLSQVGTRGQSLAPVDIEVVLDRTLMGLRIAIQESGAEITHDPLPTVMADKAQLTQVFQNLIANGIKFRREDEPPRVHVSAEREGDEWVFSVADNGIGIDSEQAERVFQVFQRLHTEDEYPGLGIGLALCQRIVERHGGRIWVESEVGDGSTFYFTLPVRGVQEM